MGPISLATGFSLSVHFCLGPGAWSGVEGEGLLPLGTNFLNSLASVSLSCASTRSSVTTCYTLQDKIILRVKRIAFPVITLLLPCACSVK